MRTRIAVLLGILLAPFLVIATVSATEAVGNCPGDYYPQQTYNYGGHAVAVLCFSDLGNGDKARLESLGAYRGVTKYMSIKNCRERLDGSLYGCVQNDGQFAYYAGPITKYPACSYFRSIMYNGSGTKIVDHVWHLCD